MREFFISVLITISIVVPLATLTSCGFYIEGKQVEEAAKACEPNGGLQKVKPIGQGWAAICTNGLHVTNV